MKGKGSNAVFMHYSKRYGTGRYGGYAAPYTPFRRNRVAIAYRVAVLYLYPVITAVLRLMVRSPTVSNGNQVAH